MQKIIFTSHCILNIASKVVLYEKDEMEAEENLRRVFLKQAIEEGVQIIQFPCPEFTLYGACRWGHVSDQFDNPFFREHCRKILAPYITQMKEYLAHPERFEILGIVGIDGSPNCGVDYTCTGNWYGSFGGRENLEETLATAAMKNGPGVMMDELRKMLQEEKLDDKIPMTSLFAPEPEKCMELLVK